MGGESTTLLRTLYVPTPTDETPVRGRHGYRHLVLLSATTLEIGGGYDTTQRNRTNEYKATKRIRTPQPPPYTLRCGAWCRQLRQHQQSAPSGRQVPVWLAESTAAAFFSPVQVCDGRSRNTFSITTAHPRLILKLMLLCRCTLLGWLEVLLLVSRKR